MDNFIEKKLNPLLSQGINSSEIELVLESLRAAKELVYFNPLDDLTQALDNALQHKNKDIAYFALEVLRIKSRAENNLRSVTPGEYKRLLTDVAIPFLLKCLKSGSDNIVLGAMNAANVLSKDEGCREILYPPVEYMMLHKNKQISHLALEIRRDMNITRDIHIFEEV